MELTFKTTLKCGGCEAKVKPFLDELPQVKAWSADLSAQPKTITVEGEQLNVQEIIATIEKAGFTAELV